MTLQKYSGTFGLDDCKLFEVTADSDTTYTCGSAIDIGAVKACNIDFDIKSETLTGDNLSLGVYSKIVGAKFSIDYGQIDFDVLNLICGGVLKASGTTPNQKQVISIMETNVPKYFQLQGLILGTDSDSAISSARFVLFKCKIDTTPLGKFTENGLATFSMSGQAVYTRKNFVRDTTTKRIVGEIHLAETADTIAAITS